MSGGLQGTAKAFPVCGNFVSEREKEMASLSLRNIKKSYDKKELVVKDFSLEIRDKEFIVFVGPSGCGKSTTLRMIAGLEEISSGELYIGERKVNDVLPKDRDVAMVFQNYALYPHMTVFDNMAFALKLKKTPKKEIEKSVREAAEILDITDYLERKPKALSGGQRQRVAIGRAIVRNPQVFLMDEPLSNLDAKLRNQMRTELIKLRKRVDTTFVYVTHDQTEAMTLGDRIVVMKDGVIQQTGTPNECFNRPANLFVAGFLGTPQMNFFEESALIKKSGRYYIAVMGREFELPEKKQAIMERKKLEEQEITVGVRPENIDIIFSGEGFTGSERDAWFGNVPAFGGGRKTLGAEGNAAGHPEQICVKGKNRRRNRVQHKSVGGAFVFEKHRR